MPDTNPSASAETEVTTPKSYDEQVSGLSNLLSDPVETPDPAKVEVDDEAVSEDDDPDGLKEIGAEAVDEPTDDTEDPNGPSEAEVKGGRFAPDSAKVKLETGETITIADLKGRVDKRVKEFQRGFTEKTQELAAQREQVNQFAQQLNQARDWLEHVSTKIVPKDPGPWTGSPDNYVGFLEWQQDKAKWDDYQQTYQTFQVLKQTETQQRQAETQQQTQQRLQREAETLKQTYPILKDPVKGPEFLQATARDAQKYFGLSQAELSQTIEDHRLFDILRQQSLVKPILGLQRRLIPQEDVKKLKLWNVLSRHRDDHGQRR